MYKYWALNICLLLFCFTGNCFAIQSSECGCCYENFIDNKIYLKPTTVHVIKNGIFINIGGELHALNHLEMDTSGIFIDINNLSLEFI